MFCTKCGEHLFSASAVCLHCGHQNAPPRRVISLQDDDEDHTTRIAFTPSPHASQFPPPKEKRDVWPIIAGAAVGVLGTIIVLMVFSGYRPYDSAGEQAQNSKPAPAKEISIPDYAPPPTPARTQAPPLPPARETYTAPRPPEYDPNPSTNANVYYPPPTHNANVYSPAPPGIVTLASGSYDVDPLSYRYFQFSVGGRGGLVTGGFESGGEVNVVLLRAEEFAGWQSHRSHSSYYNSGYIHRGRLNVRVPPGDYILILNNRRAVISINHINTYIQLRYE